LITGIAVMTVECFIVVGYQGDQNARASAF